jgi:hypothetical protein
VANRLSLSGCRLDAVKLHCAQITIDERHATHRCYGPGWRLAVQGKSLSQFIDRSAEIGLTIVSNATFQHSCMAAELYRCGLSQAFNDKAAVNPTTSTKPTAVAGRIISRRSELFWRGGSP